MVSGASRLRFSRGGSAPPKPRKICASRRRFAVGGAPPPRIPREEYAPRAYASRSAGPATNTPWAGLLGGSAPQDPLENVRRPARAPRCGRTNCRAGASLLFSNNATPK